MRIKLAVEHFVDAESIAAAIITDEQPRAWQDDRKNDEESRLPGQSYYVTSTIIDVPTSAYTVDIAALAELAGIPVKFSVGLFGIDNNNPDDPAKLLIHMAIDVSETHKISQYIATIAYHH